MKTLFHIFVPGTPQGEPRPRARVMFSPRHKEYFPHIYTVETEWRHILERVLETNKPKYPFHGPLRVNCLFKLPRTQELDRQRVNFACWAPIKPDRDNLDKTVLDVLTKLGYFEDDAQVCAGMILKVRAEKNQPPGIMICIQALNEDDALLEVERFMLMCIEPTERPVLVERPKPAEPNLFAEHRSAT